MTDNHPITPPPELVQQWRNAAPPYLGLNRESWIATQAARWGADQELEACLLEVGGGRRENLSQVIALRDARRPKPLSPKEEALQVLEALIESRRIVDPEYQALRHALEQLDD